MNRRSLLSALPVTLIVAGVPGVMLGAATRRAVVLAEANRDSMRYASSREAAGDLAIPVTHDIGDTLERLLGLFRADPVVRVSGVTTLMLADIVERLARDAGRRPSRTAWSNGNATNVVQWIINATTSP